MMKCTKCDEDIDEDEDQIVEAVINSTQTFCHLHCFRCSICHEQLTGWYFEKNGELYCRKDYYHKYGERCRQCLNVMSGPVMVAGGEVKFHPECFKCAHCHSIIGDDESYAYMEQSRLYCNQCFQARTSEDHESAVRFQKQQACTTNSRSVVQVIEIPPLSRGRQRRIRFALRDYHCANSPNCDCSHMSRRNSKININLFNSSDTCLKTDCSKTASDSSPYLQCKIQRAYCFGSANTESTDIDIAALTSVLPSLAANGAGVHISEIDVNYDLDLLHIGDRVLEMNGVCIKGKSVKEIETLIEKFRDQVIRLTVEHSHGSQGRQSALNSSSSSSPPAVAYLDTSFESPSSSASSSSALQSSDSPFVSLNGSTLNKSGQNTEYCDANIFTVEAKSNNAGVLDRDKHSAVGTTASAAALPPRPTLSLPRCYTIAKGNDIPSKETTSLLSNSISSLKKLTTTRPTSALSPSLCSIADSNDALNGTGKYPSVITPSKSIDNNRKSRSLEKRQRNRERSSSLSRLLESIRLTSIEASSPAADNCDSSLSPPLSNLSNLTMSHSLFSSPTRNGFPSKPNNSLSRTKSFRVEPKSYRIFRANDLVKGALLGKGFFGEVFEVTDKVTKEKMVLKELYHNDREAEANFVREVSILKSLNHKNVLQFIGILYRGKKLNLITEYITGGTLRQLIQDETRPIFWPERINWARDIASGVNYLHSMNLIHRDLNSQNCLVRDDGTVVVADFGLSKITTNVNSSFPETLEGNNENGLSSQQLQKLNRRRDRRKRYTIVGNPYFMAPEMMHRNKYDERVDIYSFGIILLEIIGSVNADPDVLKRNRDFSVDKKHFLDNYVKKSCPEVFWRIAFLCTEMNPDMRPAFLVLERWFQLICTSLPSHHQSSGHSFSHSTGQLNQVAFTADQWSRHIPVEILNEVANYTSLASFTPSSTPLSANNGALLSDKVV